MTETFYDVLGVATDATTDEIEAAYRERLKHVHPDVNDSQDAGESTRALIEARDVLVDEDERARYDRLGHDAYAGNGNEGDESDVAAAARRAGYGGRQTDSDPTTAQPDDGGPRQRAHERRTRERRASERVRQDRRERATQGESNADSAPDEDGGSTDGGSSDSTDSGSPRNSYGGIGPSWNSGGYGVSDWNERDRTADDWVPTGRELTLLGIIFSLYPVLLFSALVPAFPLFVNLVLGGCLVLVVGYLQSMPRIALLVFGPWSIVMPFVVVGLGLPLVSLVGIAVILATWLPFGLTVLTLSMLKL